MTDREQTIAAGLIKISDRLSEALANVESPHDDTRDSLLAINLLVWELRWQVGPFGGETELIPLDDKAEAAQ